MAILWVQLILMLILIFISAQIFTNGLEHFGQKIGISEGVVGSIFAAIATALPETTVPILAIIAGTPNKTINQEISVGAILGAPLMLSTLSTVLMVIFAIKLRGFKGRIKPEISGFKRDLNFFLLAFLFATLALFIPLKPIYLRTGFSFLLIMTYLNYLLCTMKSSKKLVLSGHGVEPEKPLFLAKIGLKNNFSSISIQLFLGLMLLLAGAKGFIHEVENISTSLNISALVLSLLIIPIATELPEKVNSILWIRRKKDTLAVGNITGAMVFQGTLLPAMGILLTPWQPSKEVLTGIIITFLAAAWLRLNASKNGLSNMALLINGLFYLIYIMLTFFMISFQKVV